MKIKICGMTAAENIAAVGEALPDFMGFIFYKKSVRSVGQDFSNKELSELAASVKRVGVFVNEEYHTIIDKIQSCSLDFVQLHGDESPADCRQLRNDVDIIKAFQIDADFNFDSIAEYLDHCDYFLFDTKSVNYGGSGKAFDWSLLKDYSFKVPFFISGGLGFDDLANLLAFSHPMLYGYDFNSRLESGPGIKDIQKTINTIQKIRNHE